MKLAAVALGLLALAIPALAQSDPHAHHRQHTPGELGADAPSTESLYHLDARWKAAGGGEVILRTLEGHPVVLAMFYASCEAICPLIVEDMKAIGRELPEAVRKQTRFVLVSFDPARDTPAKLAAYAQARKLPAESWTLLAGSDGATRELAALLGMRYRPIAGGEFSHSNLITILDAGGVPRARMVGLRQDRAAAVKALNEALAPAPRPPTGKR